MWRDYEAFIAELVASFPHEAAGIRAFYDECWRVFDSLNSLELKSLVSRGGGGGGGGRCPGEGGGSAHRLGAGGGGGFW